MHGLEVRYVAIFCSLSYEYFCHQFLVTAEMNTFFIILYQIWQFPRYYVSRAVSIGKDIKGHVIFNNEWRQNILILTCTFTSFTAPCFDAPPTARSATTSRDGAITFSGPCHISTSTCPGTHTKTRPLSPVSINFIKIICEITKADKK